MTAAARRRLGAWLRRRRIERRVRLIAAAARTAATRFDFPQLIERPPGSRILVLSPHPDDDVIGAGGTLLKHKKAGATITSLVLTDGGAGVPGQPRAEVAAMRRREEEAAARRVGIDRVIFWEEPDGGLRASDATADRLQAALEELWPDLVYLPSFTDANPDHHAVTPLLARALPAAGLTVACALYESWTPIEPNVIVDVSAEMEAKLRAVGEYRSQLARAAYDDLARARARWRSGALSRQIEYAEAFYVAPAAEYLALWRRVRRA
jgi:LmbE family N-acetylglucosaminyl deacetylase